MDVGKPWLRPCVVEEKHFNAFVAWFYCRRSVILGADAFLKYIRRLSLDMTPDKDSWSRFLAEAGPGSGKLIAHGLRRKP